MVFEFTFSGTTYIVAMRVGVQGWTLIDQGIVAATVIQSAVTYAGTVNGSVYFLQGTYTSAARVVINVPSGVVIEGSSDKTVTFFNIGFELASTGVDAGDVVFRNFRLTGDDPGFAICIDADDCTVDNILHENIEATVMGAFGLRADNDATIENVRYINCKAHDTRSHGWLFYDVTGTGTNTFRDIWLIACEAINCGEVARDNDWIIGFGLAEGTAGTTYENIFAVSCWAEGSWESGFHMEAAPTKINIWFLNCTSIDNGNDKPAPTYGHGFLISGDTSAIGCKANGNFGHGIMTGSNYTVIDGNICHGNGLSGIYCNNADNTTLSGNNCYGNTENGIHLYLTNHSTITGNTCNENTLRGIYLISSSDENTLTGNTCDGNTTNGIHVENSDENTATGNHCNGNTGSGMTLSSTTGNTITGNTCNGNTLSGISTGTFTENTLSVNTCNKNVQRGIYLVTSSNNTITGNTCNENDVNNTGSYDGIYVVSDSDDNLIHSNTCNDNGRYGIRINPETSERNWVINNQLRGNTTAPFSDAGTDTKLATIQIQLIQGTTFISAAGSAWGWEIDLDTEFALGIGWLPLEVQQVVRIRVIGVALADPGVGNAMRLQITGEGATFHEPFATKPIDVVDKDSEELDTDIGDVIQWVFTVLDDAQIGTLLGGDRLQLKVLHEGAGNGNIATNAIVDTVQIEIV